ncbi:calcium-activated chloride channel regulator 2-like isoform X2 [Lissotriton helveticus]
MIPFKSVYVVMLLNLYIRETTLVHLIDHGYENVVIAINPRIPEDQTIIKNIKANIIVADPFLKYGDDPYTLHYGRCGERGRYIHFTPNFLLKDSLLPVYGSRGRVLVHEWAHLRWGVFDEYSKEQPFYESGQNQIKATRCSSDLRGAFVCDGSSCTEGNCRRSNQEDLLKKGCAFLIDKTQHATASIMYMQALASVVDFCNESTHDQEAPHMQNKRCNYQSTWEVIKGSKDCQMTAPMSGTHLPPPPSFAVLQTREPVICLVLDVSGHMNLGNRIIRMRQAAGIFLLQIIPLGVRVGIVTFGDEAEIRAPLTLLSNERRRKQLVSHLPTTANGGSRICKGLLSALQVFQNLGDNNAHGSEIVLVTAGEDKTINSCFSDVVAGGYIIHTITLGMQAATELDQFADMTGGCKFFATDRLDSNGLIDAFIGISSLSGNLSQWSFQLESFAESMKPGQHLSGTVTFDSTVGKESLIIVTWQPYSEAPDILLQDSNEKTYTTKDFVTDFSLGIAYLQIPGTTETGNWTYTVINTLNCSQALTVTVTSRAADHDVPPVTVKVHTNEDTLRFPESLLVYAQVTQGHSPVLEAHVTAIIEHQYGTPFILELTDDGAGADAVKNDGIYSKYFFAPAGNGRHSLKVRVQGKHSSPIRDDSPSWSRAMYIPGYIENGQIQMNPPQPLFTEAGIHTITEGFSRTATGGSFLVSQLPSGPQLDAFPPCRIVDFQVETDDENIYFSWTSPGDNYDQGQASTYEIRMNESPRKLENNFVNATSFNISTLTPQLAGSRETFMFPLKDIPVGNTSSLYFAICTIDKSSLRSEVSNLVRANMWVPAFAIMESVSNDKGSNEMFVVIGSITASCFVISALIYILNKASSLQTQRHICSRERMQLSRKIDVIEETDEVVIQ